MRFYLDSANLDEIREGLTLGIEGVTTNPTSAARTGIPYEDLVSKIINLRVPEVSMQVTASDDEEMFHQGVAYSQLGEAVVVKVPATQHGIQACSALSDAKIRCNVTLVFTPMQALLAARAGAYIVSPFYARSNDKASGGGNPGFQLISNTRDYFDRYKVETLILAASLRKPEDVETVAQAGADIATVSLPLLKQLFYHPQTEEGLAKMMADWNAAQPAAWDTQTR